MLDSRFRGGDAEVQQVQKLVVQVTRLAGGRAGGACAGGPLRRARSQPGGLGSRRAQPRLQGADVLCAGGRKP